MGALSELIEDGKDGLIFEPGDVDSLCEKMRELSGDVSRAHAMGRAGRAKLMQRFTPEAHYVELMRVYEEAGAACRG